MADQPAPKYTEILTICDDPDWIWGFVKAGLDPLKFPHVRVQSSLPFRQSWTRFKNAKRLIIHWENKLRSGGAIVEEILDVSPVYDIAEHVIILTTNPTHEDVVYFSELGIRRIIRLRNRDKELEHSRLELVNHVNNTAPEDKNEIAWRKVIRALDHLPVDAPADKIEKLSASVQALGSGREETARYLDALAIVAMRKGDNTNAQMFWERALDKNPNYYRTHNNLIRFYQQTNRFQEAFGLMQKMQSLNRSSISRLVSMGEMHVRLGDDEKGEHYFGSALTRDAYCSGALNGLAEIRFRQGDLDESRKLLSRSNLAYKVAAMLNAHGIELVKRAKYKEALDHYTKAQYVIPQQEKSPMLFYNIGLCYYRWGKHDLAKEFLKIALIKEPNYKKAQKLAEKIDEERSSAA